MAYAFAATPHLLTGGIRYPATLARRMEIATPIPASGMSGAPPGFKIFHMETARKTVPNRIYTAEKGVALFA